MGTFEEQLRFRTEKRIRKSLASQHAQLRDSQVKTLVDNELEDYADALIDLIARDAR
jgi:hypothetical protein